VAPGHRTATRLRLIVFDPSIAGLDEQHGY